MMFLKSAFVLIFSMMILGCDFETVTPEELRANISLKFDPSVSQKDQNRIIQDVNRLVDLKLSTSTLPHFSKVFGGATNYDVMKYLDDRINYIIPSKVNIDDRLANSIFFSGKPPGSEKVFATNIGTFLWIMREANRPQELHFKLGKTKIPLNSSRIGLIQLGEGFSSTSVSPIHRMHVLVHEARHSDCTGGLSAEDIELTRKDKIIKNTQCGHMHVKCPKDHEYGGIYACDDHFWGAYMVGAQFTLALSDRKTCENCTEQEIQVAKAKTYDALSRVLGLKENTELPDPDMNSIGASPSIRTNVRVMRNSRIYDKNLSITGSGYNPELNWLGKISGTKF